MSPFPSLSTDINIMMVFKTTMTFMSVSLDIPWQLCFAEALPLLYLLTFLTDFSFGNIYGAPELHIQPIV